MIEFLRNWCINIVIMSILVTFIEIIIPKSEMKKYVNIVIGLLIIIVLVNPFIKLLTKDINIEKEVFANLNKYNDYDRKEDSNFAEIQKQQIIDAYKNKIKNQIIKIVESESNFEVKEIYLDIIMDNKNEEYGEISNISVIVIKNSNDKNEESKKIDIKEIDVNVSTKSKSSNIDSKTNDTIEIEELLCDYFNVQNNDIQVNVIREEK